MKIDEEWLNEKREYVEINTLEDLKAVYDKYCEKPKIEICWEPRLIIDFDEHYIEIYDDWRE